MFSVYLFAHMRPASRWGRYDGDTLSVTELHTASPSVGGTCSRTLHWTHPLGTMEFSTAYGLAARAVRRSIDFCRG